jgi:GNAT superfamily N-acetyltransferase
MAIVFLDEEVSEAPQAQKRRIVFLDDNQQEIPTETKEPVGTSIGQEISQLPAALKQSFGQPLEAIGETAQVAGFPAVATALKGAIQEPEGYVSAGQRFMEPQEGEFQVAGFAPQYAPRAVAEQTGQILYSIGSRIVGKFIGRGLGGLIGPTGGAIGGAAGELVGPAAFAAAQVVGPVALERAKNNGYTEPTDEDMAYAISTAAVSGALDSFATRFLPGGKEAVGPFFKRLGASFLGQSVPEGLQSFAEQIGGTIETKKGIQVNPKQAVGEALIGGGAGVAATVIAAPFTPEQIEEQKITERANKEAENLVIGNDNPQGKAVLANKQKLEQEIADAKQVLSAIESTDPVAQKLKLELKEKEAILAAAQGQVDSIVDSNEPVVEAEKQQIELAKAITAPVAPVSEVAPPTEPTIKETLPVAQEAPAITPAPVKEVAPAEEPYKISKQPPALPEANAPATPAVGKPSPTKRISPERASQLQSLGFISNSDPGISIETAPNFPAFGGGWVANADELERRVVYRDEKGKPKGYLRFYIKEQGSKAVDATEGLEVYVEPEYRRKGIAKQLYATASQAGYDVMSVSGTGAVSEAGAALSAALKQPAPVAETPAVIEAPAVEPAGISVGNRIKLGKSPQAYIVEEAIPQTETEKANNEQFYSVKNERTGETQVVESKDLKPVKKMPIFRAIKDAVPTTDDKLVPARDIVKSVVDLFGEDFVGDYLTIIDDVNEKGKAGYEIGNGTIYLNRAYLSTDDNIRDYIAHELGHYILGDPKMKVAFEEFWNSIPTKDKAKLERFVNNVYNDKTGEVRLEEKQVYAFVARLNAGENRNKFQILLDALKKWLNDKLGTKFKMTDRDAAAILAGAVERFKSGEFIERPEDFGVLKAAAEPQNAPIEPEAKTITEGLVQGIDIGKETNMPINNKIESHIKNFAFVRGIFESASDRLRRAKFTKLATAIDDYYDQAQRRLGFANKILLPAFDEYSKQSKTTKKKIDEEVKRFFAAQENKRDTAEFFDELNPITQKIVTAWQKFGEESGSENQRIGIKVFDKGLQRWRPIGKVEKFWPRVLKPEYKRALMEPDKYQKEYNEIVDALMKSGRIQTPEEAEVFISDYQGTGSQNDYFSGIEAARGQAFPEELYDYSTQVMTDYVARWAQHSSRIEQFGQKLGENSKTLWDRSRESTRDRRTIDYITAAQERVEGYFPNDPIVKGMSTMGIWTSGFQLGNFSSSMLNFFGGTTLNAMVGQPGALSSYLSSFVELRKLGRELKDAREKGIVSRDLMNIIGDHQVVLESSGLAKAGQKTSDFLLKWSGFTPVEQMVRTQSMIIGKSFLRKTLSSLSKNPNSSFSKQALTWLNRNNIDADKLIVEQGTGPETDKLLRYFANISQGSYTIAQTPIFIDTPIGRFLFKYQKFSTQVMRQSWKNTFEPAWKAVTNKNETLQLPDQTRQLLYRLRLAEAKELGDNRKITLDEIPKKVTKAEGKALTIIPVMMWLGSAYVGGEVILRLRDMIFGVLMKGPSYEDIIRAFEDDEDDDELYLALERAWYNLIGMGALGLIGNYAQFFMDWQDRERVKNPLDPPALSIVKETGTFIQNAVDQGKITVGDINDYLNRTLSAYRVLQRAYQTAASWTGYSDAPTVAEEMFRREVASINKYARRWAESAGLEYRSKRPSDLPTSKMTPINRKISSYLQRGEPGAAAAYAKEYLKSLPKKERANAIQSMESGARNRQPLRLGSGPMDQAEKIAFKKWLKEKVSKEKFDEIQKLDSQYQKNYRVFLNNLPNK